MTEEEREQARAYATAIGYANVEDMSDERLQRLINSIADDCEKYGSD